MNRFAKIQLPAKGRYFMSRKWKCIAVAAMVMGLSIPTMEGAALAQEPSAGMKVEDTAPVAESSTEVKVEDTAPAEDKSVEEKVESAAQENKDKEAKKSEDKKAAEKALEWFKRIKFSGDLRYRNELIQNSGKEFEHRMRLRARLYIDVNIYTGLNAVVGIGTGNSDDPVSTNQTLGEAWTSKPLWLDMVYIDWHADYLKGWRLIGGKMKNVNFCIEKTELLWDPDIRPEGLALTYKDRFGAFEPFFNGTAYWVEIRSDDRNSLLLGAQAGLKVTILNGKLYFLAGAGYHDFIAVKGYRPYYLDKAEGKDLSPEEYQELVNDGYFGNSLDPVEDDEGNIVDVAYANDFNELNTFAGIGGKIRQFPWAVFGDFVINTAASDENIGWLAGASFGKLKNALDFKFRYYYRWVQADAVVGLFNDSDFNHGATDGQGHEVNFGLQIVKNIQFALTYIYNRSPIANPRSTAYQRGQIDFNFKF